MKQKEHMPQIDNKTKRLAVVNMDWGKGSFFDFLDMAN